VDVSDLVHALKRILREPLLHFGVLGAMLFALYSAVSPRGAPARGEIVVTRGEIENLSTAFERTWQRPPTDAELSGLVESWVRDEVFYREGLALGLDRDDVVVRRRVGQKLEFLSEEATDASPPSDAALEAWLASHPADYAVEPSTSFEQAYFDPARRSESLSRDLERALASAAPGEAGDPTLLPARLDGASPREIERQFGAAFAKALAAIPPGSWQGPVRSSYGVHLVRVTARSAGRVPSLAEVREPVARDWASARARDAKEALYRKLRADYRVTIEPVDPHDVAAAK
jgi:PPIC-type PPIASE domain